MNLRVQLLACEAVTFDAAITADYGDSLSSFRLACRGDNDGNLTFEVKEPESISGITGSFTGEKGMLTFDDAALEFPLLADGQVTPVSAPWIFLKTLMGGYLTACSSEGDVTRLTIHDSYEEDALQLEIWLSGEDAPIQGEILYEDRRILTMEIENFQIQ